MDNTTTPATVFERVLGELFEAASGRTATREELMALAAPAGLDPEWFAARLDRRDEEDLGPKLDGLVTALDLDEEEKIRLAVAYVFEEYRVLEA